MAKGPFDLEKHFAFYGAYHSDPVNILIHTIFVWPILFTALLLFQFTPTLFTFAFSDGKLLAFNFAFLFALVYALFYVFMDRRAGSLAALLCLLCWIGSQSLATSLGFSLAWKVVLAAQVFCWTGQFLGHGLFEKRAPALLDNLVQAFLMAPLFVLMEVCLAWDSVLHNFWWNWDLGVVHPSNPVMSSNSGSGVLQKLLGYEPYPGFHARVSKKIEANRKEWQDKKQKKLT